MEVVRYVLYNQEELRSEGPEWTYVEFGPIKIKGRKVFRVYGTEAIQHVCVKPVGTSTDENATLMFYTVGFPETGTEPLVEVIATLNNLKPSTQWSMFFLGVICKVVGFYKGEEGGHKVYETVCIKQLKQTEVPTMKLKPRCPVLNRETVKDISKLNTVGKGDPVVQTKKEALKFLEDF